MQMETLMLREWNHMPLHFNVELTREQNAARDFCSACFKR